CRQRSALAMKRARKEKDMVSRRLLLMTAGIAAVGIRFGLGPKGAVAAGEFPVEHTDAEWRNLLNADQYAVLRKEGTERPFTSPFLTEHREGNFACAVCYQNAFSSTTKFESGTGW